jgi:hypothetical protein
MFVAIFSNSLFFYITNTQFPFPIVQLLDNLAGQKPQLTALELLMLSASVAAAASGPWILGGKLTEFLAPTAAACR